MKKYQVSILLLATMLAGSMIFASADGLHLKSSTPPMKQVQHRAKRSVNRSQTNLQVPNEEADKVKVQGDRIFSLDEKSNIKRLLIVRTNAGKMELESSIALGEGFIAKEILVKDNRLVVVGAVNKPTAKVKVMVYDIASKTPKLHRSFEVDGENPIYSSKASARLVGNRLIIASESGANTPKTFVDSVVSNKAQSFNIEKKSGSKKALSSALVISSLDISGNEKAQVSAVEGLLDEVYMSGSNLYVYYPYYEMNNEKGSDNVYIRSPRESASEKVIKKFDLSSGKAQFVGETYFIGELYGQLAMDEYNGFLRVIYDDYAAQNPRVMILDKQMKLAGKTDLPKNHFVKAVRFDKERFYVSASGATGGTKFFIYDMSNPKEMKPLSNMDMKGSVGYIHPLDKTHLLLLAEEGVNGKVMQKVMTLDVAQNPKLSSSANGRERMEYKLGTMFNGKELAVKNNSVAFDGAIYEESGNFTVKQKALIPNFENNSRLVTIGDYVYVLSKNKVTSYKTADLKLTNTLNVGVK
ncbi:MAG: beta-propeller domain-containing protein [Peptostreptococcaceae bacterium]|nr:beta-propeller domain-containing protein [Peptostreptococcaceae bacterium]